jgi:hypothetical protein
VAFPCGKIYRSATSIRVVIMTAGFVTHFGAANNERQQLLRQRRIIIKPDLAGVQARLEGFVDFGKWLLMYLTPRS